MEENKDKRTERITIRFTKVELGKIEEKCKSTLCRKLSEYVRQVLLKRPVTVVTRDRSADELLVELGRLRSELGRAGSNFNQATKKLNSLSQISEFRSQLQGQQKQNEELLGAVNAINSLIDKLAERWLR